MIKEKSQKEQNKHALSDANQELIQIKKREDVESNFIMKAFLKSKKMDQGLQDSSRESSMSETDYYETIF